MHPRLGRFLETFRGSSFPTHSETADGTPCVVKMRGAGNGAAALLSEFIVNRLASRVGLPVSDVFTIEIPVLFPWVYGTDEFDDLVKKSPGPNLALEWLPDVRPISASEHVGLPRDLISQIVTLDLAFANRDRTPRSANLLIDRQGSYWIVDHGSCRFLFQASESSSARLPEDHIFAESSDRFDAHWLSPITSTLVAETVTELPDLWLAETGFMRNDVTEKINQTLRRASEFRVFGKSATRP
jgi:hypothetical protein